MAKRTPQDRMKEAQILRDGRAVDRAKRQEEIRTRLAATAVSMFSKDGNDLGFIAPFVGVASDFIIKTKEPASYTLLFSESVSIKGETDEEGLGGEQGTIPMTPGDTVRCIVTKQGTAEPIETFVGFLFAPMGKKAAISDANTES